MWYVELIIMTGIIALFTQSVIFVDFASEEQKVNNEAINLVSILMNVQERSRKTDGRRLTVKTICLTATV